MPHASVEKWLEKQIHFEQKKIAYRNFLEVPICIHERLTLDYAASTDFGIGLFHAKWL